MKHKHPYECDETTSPATHKVLDKLQKHGCVEYQHDGGPGVIVHEQLKKIADDLSIDFYEPDGYRIFLMDGHFHIDSADIKDKHYKSILEPQAK